MYVTVLPGGVEKVTNISRMKHFVSNKYSAAAYAPEVPVATTALADRVVPADEEDEELEFLVPTDANKTHGWS